MHIGKIYQKLVVFDCFQYLRYLYALYKENVCSNYDLYALEYMKKLKHNFNMGLDWRLEVCETVLGWHSDFSA